MTMNAYDKIYLEDAMTNLAVMLDYGAMAYGDPEAVFDRFLVSDISKLFGAGNPHYVAGMSGIELTEKVIEDTGGEPVYAEYITAGRSAAYWAGWAMAYLQWYTGYPFEKINGWGVTIPFLLSLYPTYHESDISRLTETAIERMAEYRYKAVNPLKRQRRSAGLTQQELAEKSGVKLRMIQAYEQGYQDISKAEVQSVLKLARVLRCSPEDLLY